jgi:hypothetical protein
MGRLLSCFIFSSAAGCKIQSSHTLRELKATVRRLPAKYRETVHKLAAQRYVLEVPV